MDYILIGFCIVVDIYEIIDFLKPFLKKKYLKEGYKLKLIGYTVQKVHSFRCFRAPLSGIIVQ